jgi:acetyl-CoA synthetase
VTFEELRALSARVASSLDALHVKPGDRVFTLLDPSAELHATILGTIRAGAVAGPLFSAFGSEAIRDRLGDAGGRVLFVASHHLHKVRKLYGELPDLRVVVVGALDSVESPGELRWSELVLNAASHRPPSPTGAHDPMLIHYTSGTTGRPKGALHAHEALVGHAATARIVLDLRPSDVYWCNADPGWVTGTSYGILAPLALGVPSIVFSGGFSSDAWYRVIQEERVTVWYTSPTALRMLMRDGTALAKCYDLSSLRHICCVGEPLNPAVVAWAKEAFDHTVRDTWWQTETGCMQIVNYPFMPVRPGSMGRPLASVTAAILDPESFQPLPPDREGLLALRPPWPSMFRSYWGRPDLYESRFRNGWYITGDRARRDADGYYWFSARDDDVINTSGHLVGPFEVESALLAQGAVVEAAAFGVPDEAAGVKIVVKLVLRAGTAFSKELERDLRTAVRRAVGPHAVPRELVVVQGLPKTRSGKIMRRVVRAQFLGLPTGDLSALDD